jgi:hypothetical protein
MPPQCNADAYDNLGEWAGYPVGKTFNSNFDDNWFTGNNQQTVADPFTAVPLDRAP